MTEPQKKIPWLQIQDFLRSMNDQHRAMNQLQENFDRGYLTIDMAETIFVNPMKDISNSLRPILKENNIVTTDT